MRLFHVLAALHMLLISALCCNFNNKEVEKIGFVVKGPITPEYVAKIDSIDPDNKKLNKLLHLIEFYNNDTSKYFIETHKGIICYIYKDIYYDSKGKILSQSVSNYIPHVDLSQINPGEKKVFISSIPIDYNAKTISLTYVVRKNLAIESRVELQFDFQISN